MSRSGHSDTMSGNQLPERKIASIPDEQEWPFRPTFTVCSGTHNASFNPRRAVEAIPTGELVHIKLKS
ncbi:MAG TPA: hypothetical protein VF844_11785, partial [Ktedonobacteraceae bacterium]